MAAPSRLAIRWVAPARSWRPLCFTKCSGAEPATAWLRCASGAAWEPQAFSKEREAKGDGKGTQEAQNRFLACILVLLVSALCLLCFFPVPLGNYGINRMKKGASFLIEDTVA